MADPERLDRLIAAEQDERRRIALFLHDGPVQQLSGIALMLDAAVHSIEAGNTDEAREIIGKALERSPVAGTPPLLEHLAIYLSMRPR